MNKSIDSCILGVKTGLLDIVGLHKKGVPTH